MRTAGEPTGAGRYTREQPRLTIPRRFDQPVHVTLPIVPPLSDYAALLETVWRQRRLTNDGALVQALRRRLCQRLGVRHLALLGSGTLALQVAIAALGLRGEVITPAFTFPATPHALTWAGIRPVFADIDPVRLTLDPAAVERAITPRTTAILGVHVYGIPCDVDGLAAVAKRHGLRLVYDGAHCFETRIGEAPIGSFGDATMLSFHATKLFHSAEGGALIVQDEAVLRRVERLLNFGLSDAETVVAPGINAKMNELEAALGLLVLDRVADEHAAREAVAAAYRLRFAGVPGLRMLTMPADVSDSHQYAVLLVDKAEAGLSRDALHEGLRAYNVFARRYFFPLCSEAPHYRDFPSAASSNLAVSFRVSRQVLCIPYCGELGVDGAEQVAAIVLHLLGRRAS